MRIFKKLTLLLLAAVLVLGFSAADIARLPAFAETSDDSGETAAVNYEPPAARYGNAEYEPTDTSRFKRWDGTVELPENLSCYIDSEIEIKDPERVTLPKGNTLLVKNGGRLIIYSGSEFAIEGTLVIEPGAEVVVSGELIAFKDSRIDNYGTFSATGSSLLERSSVLFTGNTGTTVIAGTANVYRAGVLESCNRLTFAKDSVVKVTGKLIGEKGGVMFLKGEFALTMNAEMESLGELYLYSNAAVAGLLTLGYGSEMYSSGGARVEFTKSGFLVDDRKTDPSELQEMIESDTVKAEYDPLPEKVHWIGIDVSRYQGAIDFERVKAAGVDFVLLRSSIGDGSDTTTGEDIRFAVNVREAKKAGLMVGAYHYLRGGNVDEARTEARFFIKTISPYDLDFPAVLDFEEPWQQEYLTTAERTAMALVFMEEVEKAGYYPMLYTNTNWAENYLDMHKLGKYELWLAEWHPKPTYNGDFGIWQYTAYGGVSGIEGDVDLDVCTKNYRKIITDGGFNRLG